MGSRTKKILSGTIRSSWLQHILFWSFAYFILLSVFASDNYKLLDVIFNPIADSIYTLIFLFTLFLAVMVNLYICIPLLLKRKHYLFYLLSFLSVLFLSSWFNQILFSQWIDYILPDFYFISYYDYWDIMIFFAVFLSTTTLLKLSKEWFELYENRQQLIRLEKEKAEVELKALIGQINPHFLFNSLNVLYNLALKSSNETPGAIIKLSDILRYVIDKTGDKEVPLQSEITLIDNYIDLQRFRADQKSTIKFDSDISDADVKIAPMLFLPLVENAFKHGIKGTVNNGYMNIDLKATKEKILFTIENNKEAQTREAKEISPGIGLKNIAERLQLLYPAKHHFEINDEDDKFTVKLTLILTNENTMPDY